MTNFDVAIIGGGPSGIFAAYICSIVGLNVVLIDASSELGGQCMMYPEKHIYDIAAYERITAAELIQNLTKQMYAEMVTVYTSTKVESFMINKDIVTIPVSEKKNIHANRIILASGFGAPTPNKPRLSNIDDLESRGLVSYSMINIEVYRGKDVVIAGAGDSAIDWCISLRLIAKSITLIHRGSKLRTLRKVDMEGVNLIFDAVIDLVDVFENRIKLIYDQNNNLHHMYADVLIPCYGMRINNYFSLDLMNSKGKVPVDQSTCMSSNKLFYAIGDACVYENKRYLITTSFAEGVSAAYHIAEQLLSCAPSQHSTQRIKR